MGRVAETSRRALGVVACLALVALGAASGWAWYVRTRRPWRTFQLGAPGSAHSFVVELLDQPPALVVSRVEIRGRSVTSRLELRSLESGEVLRVLQGAYHEGWSEAREGEREWARTDAGGLVLRDATTGARVATPGDPWASGFIFARPSFAGDAVAVLTSAHTVEVWDLPARRRLRSFDVPPDLARREANLFLAPRADAVAFFPYGTHTRFEWSVATGAARTYPDDGWLLGFSNEGEALELSSDKTKVIAVAGDRSRVVATGRRIVWATVCRSGERVAIFDEPPHDDIRVVDVRTGEVVKEVVRPTRPDAGLALSPRGDRLALAWPDGKVEVWELPP